jgi:hypothetical protein
MVALWLEGEGREAMTEWQYFDAKGNRMPDERRASFKAKEITVAKGEPPPPEMAGMSRFGYRDALAACRAVASNSRCGRDPTTRQTQNLTHWSVFGGSGVPALLARGENKSASRKTALALPLNVPRTRGAHALPPSPMTDDRLNAEAAGRLEWGSR